MRAVAVEKGLLQIVIQPTNLSQEESLTNPGVELHNHFPGILAPEKLIELAFDGDESPFLQLAFDRTYRSHKAVQVVFQSTGIVRERKVTHFPDPNEEQARKILAQLRPTDTTIPEKIDDPVRYIKQYVLANGEDRKKSRPLRAAFGKNGLKLSRGVVTECSYDNHIAMQAAAATLLTANELVDFSLAYTLRHEVIRRIDSRLHVSETLQQLKEDGIIYGEVQGSLPTDMSPEEFKELLDQQQIDVRFLTMVPSDALAKAPTRTRKIDGREVSSAEWVTNRLDKAGVIGIDFAGKEAKFSVGGMQYLKELYLMMAEKAERESCYFVLRPHVGEGVALRTARGVSKKSPHRKWASQNIQRVIDILKQIQAEQGLSERLVVRFGHATHATPEQLEEIKQLDIIIEANLGSNEATGSVGDEFEKSQVILKFLYHGVRTILNTDAGGVMMTTLQNEYDAAEIIIENFKAGRIPITIDGVLTYADLPEDKQKNFDIQRLTSEAERYLEEVVPHLKENWSSKDNVFAARKRDGGTEA